MTVILMIEADENTIIERLSAETRGFESHRRLHEYKSRPGITKILLVAEDGVTAILHYRADGHWREALVDLSEAEGDGR